MRVGRAFDDPERALGELARARGPLRRIVAALAARFVARQGWVEIGFSRLGDYARERLGVSARSLQDWARVGEKLGGLPALSGGLPALEAALVSGRLSWSKVRMIARFVDADEEREWIAYAANVCVRQLERELRAVDRGALESGTVAHARTTDDGSDGEAEPAVWLRLRVPRRMAFQWRHVCRYAAKVDGQELSDGDVLERVTAETLSALPVMLERGDPDDGEEVEERSAEAAGREEVEVGAGPLVAPSDGSAEIPAFLCPLLEDVDVADPFELDARLRRAIRLEQRLDAELAPLIRQVTSAGYDWERGYRSLAALASELGMSPSKARALVRVERLGGVCPALRDGFRDGTLSYAQVQTLAPLLAGRPEGPSGTDWRAAWVRFAKTVTVRALKETVARARLARDTGGAFEEHRADPDFFAPARWDDGDRPETGEQTCARTAGRGNRTLRLGEARDRRGGRRRAAVSRDAVHGTARGRVRYGPAARRRRGLRGDGRPRAGELGGRRAAAAPPARPRALRGVRA